MFNHAKLCLMKGKNVDFNAGNGKNEMTHLGFQTGTFGTEVRCPYPYTTDSLGKWSKKIKEIIIQWQKATNI